MTQMTPHIAKASSVEKLRNMVKCTPIAEHYTSIVWVKYYDYTYYYAFGVLHNPTGYAAQLDNDRDVEEHGMLINDFIHKSLF